MGNSVLMKRIDVQHLQQEMKLGIVLKGQVRYYSFNSLLLPFQILLFFGLFTFFDATNGMCMVICMKPEFPRANTKTFKTIKFS